MMNVETFNDEPMVSLSFIMDCCLLKSENHARISAMVLQNPDSLLHDGSKKFLLGYAVLQ